MTCPWSRTVRLSVSSPGADPPPGGSGAPACGCAAPSLGDFSVELCGAPGLPDQGLCFVWFSLQSFLQRCHPICSLSILFSIAV